MKNLFVSGLAFILFISCQTNNLAVDYDSNVNFATIKTYNYYTDNTIQLNRIDSLNFMKSLDNSLRAKGLQRTSDNPNVYIAVTVYSREGNDVNTVNLGIGGGSGWFGVGTNVGIPIKKKIIDYSFQLDMDDARSNQLIWTAKTANTISYSASSASKNTFYKDNIETLVKKYPPQIKKSKKKNYYN